MAKKGAGITEKRKSAKKGRSNKKSGMIGNGMGMGAKGAAEGWEIYLILLAIGFLIGLICFQSAGDIA
nr:hypothetical protein [candidate division Zixibacteria bacterium]